ncbi:RNA degradosome polyphosphate kinase [Caproiciproducens sp. NJN-50]|uniref:RNA degradosome polyphosphate kinase n=1 Tax=Acutalibacteraceae TaxID=3082771 RepID=UPI000FFE2433|nr:MULTISPECIES: RNA degradosome polyphosphate kinase [Acutalibacteraceae]QAT49642.1 RNA degradosome polyphosphate kinase [Caproiciproducens sp. NJN-50]
MNEKDEKPAIPYINRELSWIDFNYRVLEEAFRKENPIMERMRFLGITASNLDEFFMVRVAGVEEQVDSHYFGRDHSGLSPIELLPILSQKIHGFAERQYSCYTRSVVPALKKRGIRFLKPEELSEEQEKYVSEYFDRILFPVLTPLAVDRSRPFPLLANRSLNIAVRLKGKEESYFAVVQVPGILSRFISIPSGNGSDYILLENIIIHKLGELFELNEIRSASTFRITRSSDLDIDEDTEDLLIEIQKFIKKRKRGKPVRLELSRGHDQETELFLREMLEIEDHQIYEIPGPLDLTFCSAFATLPRYEQLCYHPMRPIYPPGDFVECDDIFKAIRERDRMVHHPYESFETVIDFVRTAAEDENVLAIKQTLYRVSGHSPIVAALIRAAENGKQVTVLVELKARFDEENNIMWAKKLEEAGCHVIYGLSGLKTHCKILLVVRRDEDGIRRYVHLATGNYNDSTAKVYTDIGLFTCREPYGIDASSLFNVLTGYSHPPEYNRFIVAPSGLRSFFFRMIRNEMENAKKNLPCGITAKVNSLVDPEIIALLYQASGAGVPVRLIVRGICCLIPGKEGYSENITVRSIVGRLLEHSRIFTFENAGNTKVFLGSADWMQRNLDRRVELVFPVEDGQLRRRIMQAVDLMLKDNENAREMNSDGTYFRVDRRGKTPLNCQEEFTKIAQQYAKDCMQGEASIFSQGPEELFRNT